MKGRAPAQIRALLGEQRDRLLAHRLAESEGDLHRCRVATRRARAVSRSVGGKALARLDEELSWLGDALAPVRDLDVLIGHLRPQIDGLGDDGDGGKLVVAALERQRLFRRKELTAALESERFTQMLALFETAIESMDGRVASLDRQVARELARFTRAASALGDDPADAGIQALHIRADRGRYAAELLAGERAGRCAKTLARVHELSGKHHDAVVAEKRLRALSRPKTALAVGRFIEREHFRKRAQRSALPKAVAAAVRACERAL